MRRSAPPAAPPSVVGAAGALDGAVDWFVGGVAWWTVVFHVATTLEWHRDLAGGIWVGGLVAMAGLLLARRAGDRSPVRFDDVVPVPAWATPVLVCAGAAAAAVSATRWPDQRPRWWLFWAVVVAVSATAVWASRQAHRAARATTGTPEGRPERPDRPAPAAVALVVALAILAALGSLLTTRPDADDVFLVNRSTYVAEHPGPLPQRDTLFSDEVFAVTRPDSVPTSVEALVGVVAAWSPVTAPTVTYLAFGPLVAALAVLALWRMLRTLGSTAPALATAAASAFLLLDGGTHYSFGNFHFARAWQGKVVFLVVVVPALWHHGLRWARDGSRRDLAMLAAANTAGIGLTTTAAFVSPAVTVMVVTAGVLATGVRHRLASGLAAATPALGAVLAFAVLPRQDTSVATGPFLAWIPPWFTLSGGIEPGRQWHWIHDQGVALLVAATAAFAAWAFVRDRSARLALALAPLLLFGVFYGPGTFDAIADLTGVRAILWRSGWILPVPAAVGLLATAPLLLARSRLRLVLSVAVPAVLAAAMVAGTTWVLDPGNAGIRISAPAWDVDPTDRAAAQRLIDLSEPGDVILAPEEVGGVVAIQTTRVRAVNPRGQYMRGRHAVPEFRSDDREAVSHAAAAGAEGGDPERLAQALGDLEVVTACIAAELDDAVVDDALRRAGLELVGTDARCGYWRRR